MLTVRIPADVYRNVLNRLRPNVPLPERALEKGANSYLNHPRVVKLSLDGTREERLEELMLMLAQTQASQGVLEIWKATEGRDYSAGREEYVALAKELESLEQGPVRRLKAEVEAFSREVTELEAELRASGGDPEEVQPPFPKTVTRPVLSAEKSPAERRGALKRLVGDVRHLLFGMDR